MNLVEQHIDTINSLCAKHKVSELYVFGSVLTDTFNTESDIDLLVEFDGVDLLEYADNYFNLKEELESILHREIDLVENKAVRKPIFRKVLDREKKLLYERKSS